MLFHVGYWSGKKKCTRPLRTDFTLKALSVFGPFNHHSFCLVIILSRDVPLLKSDFFSCSEYFAGLSVDIFMDAERSNPRRYTCRKELMHF